MTNTLYDNGRQALSDGNSIAWATDTIRAVLVDYASYTPNVATDSFLSDIPSGARASISGPLTGKTNGAGVFICDPFTFGAVPSGGALEAVVIYKDTGTPSTSRLIALIDTASGLPVTPNDTDIICTPDTGANKLFKI